MCDKNSHCSDNFACSRDCSDNSNCPSDCRSSCSVTDPCVTNSDVIDMCMKCDPNTFECIMSTCSSTESNGNNTTTSSDPVSCDKTNSPTVMIQTTTLMKTPYGGVWDIGCSQIIVDNNSEICLDGHGYYFKNNPNVHYPTPPKSARSHFSGEICMDSRGYYFSGNPTVRYPTKPVITPVRPPPKPFEYTKEQLEKIQKVYARGV